MSAPALLAMAWRDVAFLHWPADAAALAPTLPPGVELDRFDGTAWLSIVPFRLCDVRMRGTPVLPGFRSVLELNLRTYVRVGSLRGIWFYSLDAASVPAVAGARLLTALPYFHARITTSERDGTIAYASERHDARGGASRFDARYRAGGDAQPAEPGSLDAFLHERYRFFPRATADCSRPKCATHRGDSRRRPATSPRTRSANASAFASMKRRRA